MHRYDCFFVYNLDKQFTSLDYDSGGFVRYLRYLVLCGFVHSLIPPFFWVLDWQVECPGKVRCVLLIAVLPRRLAAGGPMQRPQPRLQPSCYEGCKS